MSVQVEIQTFVWKNQTRYKCPLLWNGTIPCEFDSHDLDALREHMVKGHKPPEGVKSEIKAPDLSDPSPSNPDPEFEFVKFKDASQVEDRNPRTNQNFR